MTASSLVGPDTLFVGAPTRLGHALNGLVRAKGAFLKERDVLAFSNKKTIHALRSAIGDNANARDIDAMLASARDGQLFLSALYCLGRPATALRGRDFFPEAERMLEATSAILAGRVERIIVAIEPVHHLLLSVGRDAVLTQSAGVRWEALFDVSWTELIGVISGCFPGVSMVVITPHARQSGAAPLLHHLFGSAGFELAGEGGGEIFFEVSQVGYQLADIKEKTGLDRVACDLLSQRFLEDVSTIKRRMGVRVF